MANEENKIITKGDVTHNNGASNLTHLVTGGVQIFSNEEFGTVRSLTINGEPWFVGKDVAMALGYGEGKSLANAVAKHVDKDDKGVTELMTPGGKQHMVIINESDLYALIFGSKLKSARRFKHWVTSEVLPSIRKTGSYQMTELQSNPLKVLELHYEAIKQVDNKVDQTNNRVNTLEDRLDHMEMDLPILPLEADRITEAVYKKGVYVLGGKESLAYKNHSLRSRVHGNIYSNLKYNFAVRSYKSIKRNQCDQAVQIVNSWEPPVFLATEIDYANHRTQAIA